MTVCFLVTPFFVSSQDVKPQSNTPLELDLEQGFFVIAHRGASAYYPENTMSAFRAAVEMKADMIELDVLLSKDDIPVVFHDAKLNKRSNGKGLVSNYSFEELRKLDAGSWFHSKFRGEKIPSLKEVLEFTKDKVLVNIEIKTEAVSDKTEEGIVELVLDMVKELEIEDQIIISSFDYRVMERVRARNSEIKLALLYEKKQSGKRNPVQLVKDYNVDAFNFGKRYLSDGWIKQLNENGIPFFVYTVNDEDTMREIIRSGAKGIFSDKPDVLKQITKSLN